MSKNRFDFLGSISSTARGRRSCSQGKLLDVIETGSARRIAICESESETEWYRIIEAGASILMLRFALNPHR